MDHITGARGSQDRIPRSPSPIMSLLIQKAHFLVENSYRRPPELSSTLVRRLNHLSFQSRSKVELNQVCSAREWSGVWTGTNLAILRKAWTVSMCFSKSL